MKKLLKLVGKLILAAVGLFALTFGVYMGNFDMKLLAFLEPYMDKIYDLRKREDYRV
ncbi:MAG: hypothetical protein J5847_02420 [Clostridia bacterium]|nr:hypothetical protein [Clostridia bacterium]MBR5753913.1 hypothetical protein [Clostridia bacterium]